ncbi:MAG: hypothetical protein MRJ67_03740 [Nitrospirales bacterium]|nr:hypothetical protein [Nitrospirales bacterium]MDR4482718.1 hypothetical protein [Nitrospirales bacterium]
MITDENLKVAPPSLSADRKSPPSETEPLHQPTSSEDQSTPWICRRPVRITIYGFLIAFGLWMLGWGIVPRLLDPTFERHLQDKSVMAGMSREQVMDAWGSPYQMNVSYTEKGIRREEWIYEDWLDSSTIKHRYLYFEEGKLIGGWY